LALTEEHKWAEAEPMFRDTLVRRRKVLAAGHSDIAHTLTCLGIVLTATGRALEAEPLLREGLENFRKGPARGNWWTPNAESLLGDCFRAQGRYAEAEPVLLASYDALKSAQGVPAPRLRKALDRIVNLYEAWGKPEKAAEWRGRAEVPDKK